jgi:hypothetical protein
LKALSRIWPLVVYGCLVAIYGNSYFYDQMAGDGISYLSIAEKYARGDFYHALNAYWSPMISWLAAILMKTGLSPLWSLNVLKLAGGVFIILMNGRLVKHFSFPLWGNILVQAIVAGWAARFALHNQTPDFLLVGLLMLYLEVILSGKWKQRPVWLGVLGAALYFTKGYGFYFFAAHQLLLVGYRIIITKSFKQNIKAPLITIAVFLLLSFGWMSLLSIRYEKPLVSSAGAYNHSILLNQPNHDYHPSFHSGLLALPDSSAYSFWEEITLVYPYTDWNPFENKSNFMRQCNIVAGNGIYTLKKIYGANRFSWLALLTGFYFFIIVLRKRLLKKTITDYEKYSAHITAFACLYAAGYALLLTEERYLWIFDIALLYLLVINTIIITQKFAIASKWLWLFSAVVWALCAKEQIDKLNYFSHESATELEDVKNTNPIIPAKSHVATHISNTISTMVFFNQWKDHGGLEAYKNSSDAKAALQQYNINWVLIPDSVLGKYEWLQAESDTVINVKNWALFRLK